MAFAEITVKDISPKENDVAISLDTIFSFRLFPVGNGTSIDIDTLSIEVKETTHGHGTNTYTFTNSSSQVTVTTSGNSYKVEVDVDPDGSNKFSSRSTVVLTVNVSSTGALAMRQFKANYKTVDINQLSALIDVTSTFTEIGINYEQGRINLGGTTCSFTYNNWVQTVVPVVFLNDIPQSSSGYSINYTDGKIIFNPALSSGYNTTDIFTTSLYAPPDRVNCDYFYSCFSNQQLISFMKMGLTYFNANYPISNYTLTSSDPGAIAAAVIGASYYLYNSVVAGFLNQQWRVQWGEEEWHDLIGVATTMKENTSKILEEIKEAKKHTLTKNIIGIVTTDYTLPGGRSRMFRSMFGGQT